MDWSKFFYYSEGAKLGRKSNYDGEAHQWQTRYLKSIRIVQSRDKHFFYLRSIIHGSDVEFGMNANAENLGKGDEHWVS